MGPLGRFENGDSRVFLPDFSGYPKANFHGILILSDYIVINGIK